MATPVKIDRGRDVDGTVRVTGADESYLLAEDLFGLSAPIQFVWAFDDDPGFPTIVELRDRLAVGTLNRRVMRTRVPAARDRWVRAETVPSIDEPPRPIATDGVGAWADERLRSSSLRPADGQGWRLDTTPISGGGRAVSLLVSHMIADGQGVYRALAVALDGSPAEDRMLPSAPPRRDPHAWRVDVVDGLGQVAAAGRSIGHLIRAAVKARRDGASAEPSVPVDTAPAAPPPDIADEPDTTLAIVDLDRDELHTRAKEYGGTANTLFTAVLAGIVQRSGYPVGEEMRICIAVSNRTEDDDERANASGGVWIRLRQRADPRNGLTEIRSSSKRAFVAYAESGAEQVADNLQPVVRLLPRRLIGAMMQSVRGPDTTVSNLGVAPTDSVSIGGRVPSSFAIRAIMKGRPAANRRVQGPALAAWAVEYADKVTLTFFGVHPDHFGDEDRLRKQIAAELATWRLSYRWW